MLQLITTVLFFTWMFLVLLLLFVIWRRSTKRNQELQQALIDSAVKSAEAARASGEATRTMGLYLEQQVHHGPIVGDEP